MNKHLKPRTILAFLVFIIMVTVDQTGSAKSSVYQRAIEKYSKVSSLQADLKKTDEKKVLGTKTLSQGMLKISKNKIYLYQEGEKKIEMFYQDRVLSLVEHPDLDFGAAQKRKVTILKKNIPSLVKSVLNIFMNPKEFAKEFQIEKQTELDGVAVVNLKSARKEIRNLIVKIDSKTLDLRELSFVDDVDNLTQIELSNSKFNVKLEKKDFEFKALKSDEVLYE